jgi:hypothetical protein
MADLKNKNTDDEIKEIARAVNTQARLLAEIVKAADHIVKAYLEVTKPVEEHKNEKESKASKKQ